MYLPSIICWTVLYEVMPGSIAPSRLLDHQELRLLGRFLKSPLCNTGVFLVSFKHLQASGQRGMMFSPAFSGHLSRRYSMASTAVSTSRERRRPPDSQASDAVSMAA